MDNKVIYTAPEYSGRDKNWTIHKIVNNKVEESYTANTEKGAIKLMNLLTFQETDKQVTEAKESKNANSLSGKAKLEYRRNVCLRYKLLGFSADKIFELVNNGGINQNDQTLYWDISYKTICAYLKDATETLYADPIKEREELLKEGIERWGAIMQVAMINGDTRVVRDAAKQLDKINNIENNQLTVNLKKDQVKDLSDEELLAKIAELQNTNTDSDEH